jgi:hypothetical protein
MKRLLVVATLALGFAAPAAFAQSFDVTPNEHYRNAPETTTAKQHRFDLKEPTHESPSYIS